MIRHLLPLLLVPLALVACKDPEPVDLGDVQTLPNEHLEAHLGKPVIVHGFPNPTRVIEYQDPKGLHMCSFFYLVGNRNLFLEDCTGEVLPEDATSDDIPTSFTGKLSTFGSHHSADTITDYFLGTFGIEIPESAYVLSVSQKS